jgi:hypothetical protein
MTDTNTGARRALAVREQFEIQAKASDELGSPFTAMLCRVLGQQLDLETSFGRTILEWPGDPLADNIALRACGALHALKLAGWEPELAKVYPPGLPSVHTLWFAIAEVLKHHDAFLTARLATAPQTNEVARSGLLLGGMLHLAKRTGLPLALYEIGASAGLNLGFDAYRYHLAPGREWGRADAPLTIDCAWRGNLPPLDAPLRVISRAGCDLRPVDPANRDDAERLMSYVWPDQTHRLERTAAALKLAAAEGRQVEQADAAEWLGRQWSAPQKPGTARVLFHTIVWTYLPADIKAAIEVYLARLGESATPDRPLARFAFEQDATPGSGAMTLTLWPTGETINLGRGDFHGRWAEWS